MQEIAVVNAASSPVATTGGAGSNLWWAWVGGAVAWLILLVTVGRVMKLFRTDSIIGPERLGHDESAWTLISVLGFGMLAAFSVPIFLRPVVARLSSDQQIVSLNAAVYIAGFAAMIGVSYWWRGDQTSRIGLRLSKIGIGLIGGLTGLVLIYPLVLGAEALVEAVFTWLHLPMRNHEMLTLMGATRKDSWVFWVTVGTACVLAPLTEELLFRGMLQTALGRGFATVFGRNRGGASGVSADGPAPAEPSGVLNYARREPDSQVTPNTSAANRWAAVITASLAFAAIHQSAAFFLPLFVLSVGFGYLYERTGNLWATITAHGLFNLTNTLIFLYTQG